MSIEISKHAKRLESKARTLDKLIGELWRDLKGVELPDEEHQDLRRLIDWTDTHLAGARERLEEIRAMIAP